MRELHGDTFRLTLFNESEHDGTTYAADTLVEVTDGERYAGTISTAAELTARLIEHGTFLPVTDTLLVREFSDDVILQAIRDLLEKGQLDEVFLEVLEDIQVEE